MKFDNQCCLFDITLSKKKGDEEGLTTYKLLAYRLSSLAKKFVFQLEKGDEDGYIHWQIRLSLHKRQTCSHVHKNLIPHLPGHWSVTSNEVHDSGNQFNYVMKIDSRIDGPWSDLDNIPPPATLTPQLTNYWAYQRYPWQIDIERISQEYNERHLHYVYDPHYNSGKSILCEDLEYRDLACEIPGIYSLAEDICQFTFCQQVSKCYLFDLPAAMKKEKMHQMYMALEMIKNGLLFDKRYKGVKKRIPRPAMIIFANNLPKMELMAPDRWIIWYVTPDKRLVRYDSNVHPYTTDKERDIADFLSMKNNQ